MYSKKEIPVNLSEVAIPLKVKKWHYLDWIAGKIASDDAVSIDVQIGVNCTNTVEPSNFIARKNAGPYALETVLGWCCETNWKEL